MDATVAVLDEGRSSEELHRLALGLRQTLEREAALEAHLVEDAPAVGARGDAVSVGTLALTFLSSGAAVAMFGVLRAMFERDRNIRIELGRPDGATLAIEAKNMEPAEIGESTKLAREFFGEQS